MKKLGDCENPSSISLFFVPTPGNPLSHSTCSSSLSIFPPFFPQRQGPSPCATLIEGSNMVPESTTDQQLQDPMPKEPQFPEETQGSEPTDTDVISLTERFSEPYILGNALRDGLGDDRSIHKLMAMAVHAVLLDSGFVGFDPVLSMQIDRFDPQDELSCPVSVCYSLPQLLRNAK